MTSEHWLIVLIIVAMAAQYFTTVSNPCSAMSASFCDVDVARQF